MPKNACGCTVEEMRRACREGIQGRSIGKVCGLVHGRLEGPMVDPQYRQSKLICAQSSLQRAFSQDDRTPVPPKGGIHMSNVCLRNEQGEFDPSLQAAFVYAAAAKKSEAPEADQQYFQDMEEKVRNVLRIMDGHFHEELFLGAWGCGEYLKAPPQRMAEIFGKVLKEQGDGGFFGRFKRVTFAIKGAPEALAAFQAEFQHSA